MITSATTAETPAPSPQVTKSDSVLILGLGNILLTDEGVGVHIVNRLAQEQAGTPGIECMDGGTLSFMLANAIVSTDALIVVDTAALNAPPGTVQVFEGDAMDHFVSTGGKSSVHEVSLSDLLAGVRWSASSPRTSTGVNAPPRRSRTRSRVPARR